MSTIMAEWRVKRSKEDEQLHEQLCAAVAAGRVELHTWPKVLDYQGSPVHNPWDHLAPLLGLMTLALVILLSTGVAIGIVAMTFCVFAHLMGTKHYVAWALQRRTVAYMAESAAHWQHVWKLGGVAVVLKDSLEPPCIAPKGDWRKFVRRNLPEDLAAAPAPEPQAEAAAPPPPPPPPPPRKAEPEIIVPAPPPPPPEPEAPPTIEVQL